MMSISLITAVSLMTLNSGYTKNRTPSDIELIRKRTSILCAKNIENLLSR